MQDHLFDRASWEVVVTAPGAPTPRKADGSLFRLCWTDDFHRRRYFADLAEAIFAHWWPDYRTASYDERQRMRLLNAVAVRSWVAATVVADADIDEIPPTEDERRALLCDTRDLGSLAGVIWNSSVPLVLIEGAFAPDTPVPSPVSGIDGDVRDPSNIPWLPPRTAEGYLRSLARAERGRLAIRADPGPGYAASIRRVP